MVTQDGSRRHENVPGSYMRFEHADTAEQDDDPLSEDECLSRFRPMPRLSLSDRLSSISSATRRLTVSDGIKQAK